MTQKSTTAAQDATTLWRAAYPIRAMRTLADAGYDQAARFRFLTTTMHLNRDLALDFSYNSYIAP
jgi:hypothetical protein